MNESKTTCRCACSLACALVLTAGSPASVHAHGTGEHTGDDRTEHPQTEWSTSRSDGHAPIGVMGDHLHEKGEFMLSYRYMHMYMDGNLDGTDSVGKHEVLEDFLVTPTWMTMDMHMLGFMYAPTSDLTLMAMMPFLSKEMKHLTRTGVRFRTRSAGPGDFRLTGLYSLLERGWHRLHLNAGVSFPTGSITERDSTPMGPNSLLPYPMRLGSGTFDLMPGMTYLGQSPRWSWGAQSVGTIHLGENDHNYALGDAFDVTAWGARQWGRWVSVSLRADFGYWDDIDGQDPRLLREDPMGVPTVPTAQPNLRGGKRLDLLAGINVKGTGKASAHRTAIEFGAPVFEDLDGPQLETDWMVMVGWQFSK